MKVEIDISEGLLKKLKALSILSPVEGGVESIVEMGLESWVDAQIISCVRGEPPSHPAPVMGLQPTRAERRRTNMQAQLSDNNRAYDASGISSGLSDDADEFEDEARTSDPEAFVQPQGALTEEGMERDMRISDPQHEAKVDASTIKEKKLTGSDSYRTPEQLFADHSGLPTPPPVLEDARAAKRRKKQTGRGRASMFTGHEESTI